MHGEVTALVEITLWADLIHAPFLTILRLVFSRPPWRVVAKHT